MAKQDVKNRFLTGAIPTQDDFGELIDTCYNDNKITISTEPPSGGVDGEIWFQYSL